MRRTAVRSEKACTLEEARSVLGVELVKEPDQRAYTQVSLGSALHEEEVAWYK
jgi:hypothetical protein